MSTNEQSIQAVIAGILGASSDEARESEIYRVLGADDRALEPSSFFFNYKYPIDKAIEVLIHKKVTDFPSEASRSQFTELFTSYEDFYYPHLSEVFCKLEGSACSADKAGFVLVEYMRSLRGKEPAEWDTSKYFIPKTGEREIWMNLCASMVKLRFGKYSEYVNCREKLSALAGK